LCGSLDNLKDAIIAEASKNTNFYMDYLVETDKSKFQATVRDYVEKKIYNNNTCDIIANMLCNSKQIVINVVTRDSITSITPKSGVPCSVVNLYKTGNNATSHYNLLTIVKDKESKPLKKNRIKSQILTSTPVKKAIKKSEEKCKRKKCTPKRKLVKTAKTTVKRQRHDKASCVYCGEGFEDSRGELWLRCTQCEKEWAHNACTEHADGVRFVCCYCNDVKNDYIS